MKYKISNIKRKYSPTPIVRIETDSNNKKKEIFVACCASPKEDGDKLSEEITSFLNKKEMDEAEIYQFAIEIFEKEEGRKPDMTGAVIGKDEIAVACIHTGIAYALKL